MKKLKIVEQDIRFLLDKRCGFGTTGAGPSIIKVEQRVCMKIEGKYYNGTIVDTNSIVDGVSGHYTILFDDYDTSNPEASVADLTLSELNNNISKGILILFDITQTCDEKNGTIINPEFDNRGKIITSYKEKNRSKIIRAKAFYNNHYKSRSRNQIPDLQPSSQSPSRTSSRRAKQRENIIIQLGNITDDQIKTLELLAYADMYKDFIINTTVNDFKNRVDQQKILINKINQLLPTNLKNKKNSPSTSPLTSAFFDYIDGILELKTISTEEFSNVFFDKIGLKDLGERYNFKPYLNCFLYVLTNISDNQQDTIINEFKGCFDGNKTYNNLNKFREKYEKTNTLYWTDASPGYRYYDNFYRYIRLLYKKDIIKGFYTPATSIDDAPRGNESYMLTKDKLYTDYLIPDITNISITNTSNEFLNVTVQKIPITGRKSYIKSIVENEEDYVLEINRFYDLNCNLFSEDHKDIFKPSKEGTKNAKINRTNVIERLTNIIFNDPSGQYYKHENLDLCIKANKTMMDMLKQLYAIDYINKNQEFLISVFNDKNAARLMAFLSKGLVIYTVKETLAEIGSERVIMKKKLYDKILAGIHVSNNELTQIDQLENQADPDPETQGIGPDPETQAEQLSEDELRQTQEQIQKEYADQQEAQRAAQQEFNQQFTPVPKNNKRRISLEPVANLAKRLSEGVYDICKTSAGRLSQVCRDLRYPSDVPTFIGTLEHDQYKNNYLKDDFFTNYDIWKQGQKKKKQNGSIHEYVIHKINLIDLDDPKNDNYIIKDAFWNEYYKWRTQQRNRNPMTGNTPLMNPPSPKRQKNNFGKTLKQVNNDIRYLLTLK